MKQCNKSIFANFSCKEKQPYITEAQDLFLSVFPLADIDNSSIRTICRKFRNKEETKEKILKELEQYNEYFWNWFQNNRMIDVFYFQK